MTFSHRVGINIIPKKDEHLYHSVKEHAFVFLKEESILTVSHGDTFRVVITIVSPSRRIFPDIFLGSLEALLSTNNFLGPIPEYLNRL